MIEFMDSFRFEDYDDAIRFINRIFNMILEGAKSYKLEDYYWKHHYCKMNVYIPYKLMRSLEVYGFDMGYQKELIYAIVKQSNKYLN